MKVVSGETMALLDARAQSEGAIPGLLLMEDAGQKAWKLFLEEFNGPDSALRDKNLIFVAGGGNNGGDVLVMARAAYTEGYTGTRVLLLSERGNEASVLHRQICKAYGIPSLVWENHRDEACALLQRADFIFDGISGTGLRGALREPARSLVKELNSAPGRLIAVDTPSGLGDGPWDLAAEAEVTLTMELVKYSQLTPRGRTHCGKIIPVPLGFPPDLVAAAEKAADYYRPRDVVPPVPNRYGYKNSRGHLLVAAGSPGTEGAAFLSARSAASSGAGLVSLLLDPGIAERSCIETSGVMVRSAEIHLPGDVAFADAAVAGPGWGRNGEREAALRIILEQVERVVIDADALDILGSFISPGEGNEWILTPHPGELVRLLMLLIGRGFSGQFPSLNLGQSEASDPGELKSIILQDPLPVLKELSSFIGSVVVLKSHISHIAAADGRYAIIDGTNPYMGTGGSGDILAGLCGSFLLRPELDAFGAAVQAVAAHQRAGYRAAEKGWFTAAELLSEVGAAAGGIL